MIPTGVTGAIAMLFRLITLCAVAGMLAHAGSVTNSDGMKVEFNVTGTKVDFYITAPASIVSGHDYWGIGFKSSGSRSDMVNSNLWMVTKSGTFYDVWSTRDDTPDTSVHGTATLASHTADSAGAYTSHITRNLAAASSREVNFAQGSSYLLTYAYGPIVGGQLAEHSIDGSVTITLTNDYVATEDSSLAVPVAVGVGTAAVLFLALY